LLLGVGHRIPARARNGDEMTAKIDAFIAEIRNWPEFVARRQ
jgi:hypothetical protein